LFRDAPDTRAAVDLYIRNREVTIRPMAFVAAMRTLKGLVHGV